PERPAPRQQEPLRRTSALETDGAGRKGDGGAARAPCAREARLTRALVEWLGIDLGGAQRASRASSCLAFSRSQVAAVTPASRRSDLRTLKDSVRGSSGA